MKVLLKRLKKVENQIKNNNYDKFNLALREYERIKLIERIAQYN